MLATLTIQDATSCFGSTEASFTLDVSSERITVRELIRARVYHEVQQHNDRQLQVFRGHVQPTKAERTLNSPKLLRRQQIDPEPQFKQALLAFQSNALFILVDDLQVDDLEHVIEVRPQISITFLKLVPLVGG